MEMLAVVAQYSKHIKKFPTSNMLHVKQIAVVRVSYDGRTLLSFWERPVYISSSSQHMGIEHTHEGVCLTVKFHYPKCNDFCRQDWLQHHFIKCSTPRFSSIFSLREPPGEAHLIAILCVVVPSVNQSKIVCQCFRYSCWRGRHVNLLYSKCTTQNTLKCIERIPSLTKITENKKKNWYLWANWN